MLCPATGYVGDYIWQGDAKSACLEILKYNNISADEWQMGTTKVFIKHPETVGQKHNEERAETNKTALFR